jgi:transcriptional regulator with XRE-family HTH domain
MAGISALKAYRKARKLTLRDMGREFGVTGQTIWRWENGARAPRSRELPVISEKTGIPIADLVTPDDWNRAAAE